MRSAMICDDPSPARALRVLVVDGQEVVRFGFRLALTTAPWSARCLLAGDDARALELAERFRPHVAVVDLELPGRPGVELIAPLRRASSPTRVLLASSGGHLGARAARRAGATGFVYKSAPLRELLDAIAAVGRGRPWYAAPSDAPDLRLSARERDVLALIADGRTNREIARALHLSPYTVKDHTQALYRRLGARNRAEAVQRGQSLGLVPEAARVLAQEPQVAA